MHAMKPPNTDDRAVWDVYLSVYRMPSLAAADAVGLFEALERNPATAAELAQRMGLREHALRALLPMLSALGFLVPRLGRYQLTEAARLYLLHGSPLYWGHAFGPFRDNPAARIFIERLKGETGIDGMPSQSWESGKIGREMGETIARFMNSHSLAAAASAARIADFSATQRLLDVGGGSGCFSIAFAQTNPSLRATVMDLAAMCEMAHEYIAAGGVADRVDTVSVDMFREEWPTGYDAVFLSNVFHDWDGETNAGLAARAFRALPSGGRIVLHEMLINDEGSGPLSAASFSMMMLFGTKGRQYSLAELKDILEGAGFRGVRATEGAIYHSLVEAMKP